MYKRQVTGRRTEDSLAGFVDADRIDTAVARLEDLEVELAAGTIALPGARELLSAIPGRRWAIATSASKRLGSARWAGAGIPTPQVVVTAEDVANGIPDPEPYLLAADRLGVDIAECIVVEDSPGGAASGHAAGAQVLAVGDQPWPTEPVGRVRDLRDVTCNVTDDGQLSLVVTSESV